MLFVLLVLVCLLISLHVLKMGLNLAWTMYIVTYLHRILIIILFYLMSLTILLPFLKSKVSQEILKRKKSFFRKTNLTESEWENLNEDLKNTLKDKIPFEHLLNAENLASSITDCYQTVVDKHMPLRKLSKKQNVRYDKPWITSGFKVSLKKNKELQAIYNKTKCPMDEIRYLS